MIPQGSKPVAGGRRREAPETTGTNRFFPFDPGWGRSNCHVLNESATPAGVERHFNDFRWSSPRCGYDTPATCSDPYGIKCYPITLNFNFITSTYHPKPTTHAPGPGQTARSRSITSGRHRPALSFLSLDILPPRPIQTPPVHCSLTQKCC